MTNKIITMAFFILLLLFSSSYAAEYYSSSEAYLQGENKTLLLMQKKSNTTIQWANGRIKFDPSAKLPAQLEFFKKPTKPKQLSENIQPLADILSGEKKFKKIASLEEEIAELRTEQKDFEDERLELHELRQELDSLNRLPVYNFAYLLSNNPRGRFFLKINNDYLFIQRDDDTIRGKNIFTGLKETLDEIEFRVIETFDDRFQEVGGYPGTVLEKKQDSSGRLLEFELFDKYKFTIYKVENEKLETFEKELKTRVLEVTEFSFANETLYCTYVENKENQQQRMFVEYAMTGKKKNIIKIAMKAPISLFDPENRSSDMEENVGFMGDVKGKDLVELKKVQLINGKVDTEWKNRQNSPVLSIVYQTVEGKDKKLWSKNKKKRYYGIEGVWYLAHWMNQYNVKEKKIAFLNGPMATDFTMTRKGDRVFELSKMGNPVYRYTLDNKGFIRQFEFPGANQVVVLEGIENDTTRRNRIFLEEYKKENHIVILDF